MLIKFNYKIKQYTMRKLVDLGQKIAVITWFEEALFPIEKENRYKELLAKKGWEEKLSEEEEHEYNSLKTVEGPVKMRIESVQITNLCPVETNLISTTFSITGQELIKIQTELEKLEQEYQYKKDSLYEVIEVQGNI
jgi:hypothetical protein